MKQLQAPRDLVPAPEPLAPAGAADRLMEEINILRLEGALFCFDPKEARRRQGRVSLAEARERPVSIEISPYYGQPSVLAYKVLQAIFLKVTEEGYPYPNGVSFSHRELGRLVGRSSIGGNTAKQLYQAIMQLRSTIIHCSLYNKETKEWAVTNFSVLSKAVFAGRSSQITQCYVRMDEDVAKSINKRHIAFFNIYRLNTLETIGMVLYKRLFFHLSNLYYPKISKDRLLYEKSYQAICAEWLGGLKPERYKSRIVKQLGQHLDGLKATRLLHRYEIAPMADQNGWKIIFYPGRGFFDDYDAYYVKNQTQQLKFNEAVALRYIQKPLEMVAYFHERLGHEGNTFPEKETAQVSKLLETYSDAEVHEFIDYALAQASETNFRMQHFGAVLGYLERWNGVRAVRQAHDRRRQAIAACPHCDENGHIILKDLQGSLTAHPCSHDAAELPRLEGKAGLRRV